MRLTPTTALILVLSSSVAACSGVSSGSIPPPTATARTQTSAATVQPDSASITRAGTIEAMISGGFTLSSSGCGYVHVFLSSSTQMSGPSPAVHETASVTGTGSCATSINASSVQVSAVSGTDATVVSSGCTMFPAGDSTYNRNISAAAIDPNSAAYIASVQQAGDTASFYASTGVEKVNLATNSTPMVTVSRKVSYHSFPAPYPWASGFYIEPLSDAHAIVVQTQSCHLYESYGTTYSGGVLSAYSGANWDLTKPFVPLAPGTPSAMASGLPLFAGMVTWTDYQSGVIAHPLNWAAIAGSVSKYGFVPPASDTDQLTFKGTSCVSTSLRSAPAAQGIVQHRRLGSRGDDGGASDENVRHLPCRYGIERERTLLCKCLQREQSLEQLRPFVAKQSTRQRFRRSDVAGDSKRKVTYSI